MNNIHPEEPLWTDLMIGNSIIERPLKWTDDAYKAGLHIVAGYQWMASTNRNEWGVLFETQVLDELFLKIQAFSLPGYSVQFVGGATLGSLHLQWIWEWFETEQVTEIGHGWKISQGLKQVPLKQDSLVEHSESKEQSERMEGILVGSVFILKILGVLPVFLSRLLVVFSSSTDVYRLFVNSSVVVSLPFFSIETVLHKATNSVKSAVPETVVTSISELLVYSELVVASVVV